MHYLHGEIQVFLYNSTQSLVFVKLRLADVNYNLVFREDVLQHRGQDTSFSLPQGNPEDETPWRYNALEQYIRSKMHPGVSSHTACVLFLLDPRAPSSIKCLTI